MKWFKHDTDANTDNRLQNVLLDYGLEGYGLYWYCLELIASKVDREKVTFELEHDARVIARNTGSTPQKVEEMMRYFVSIGLFENADGIISCLKMAKRLDKSMTSNTEMRKIIEGMALTNTQLDGYVYFIEKRVSSGEVVAIKIGRSKNPSSRMSELSKLDENIGYSLSMFFKIKSENCVALETEMHRKFKDICIYNEWFKPCKSIYDFIDKEYVMTTTADAMQDKIRLDKSRRDNKEILSCKPDCVEVIEYLNSVTGSKYKATTASHAKDINGRFSQGHSIDDLKMVIDFKNAEWKDDAKMSGYLRPATLFGASKFDGYLKAAKTVSTKQNGIHAVGKPIDYIPEGFN